MYYFVTDIVSVRNDLWEIYGEVDALATAKTAILASTQYVSYSSSAGSTWLADTRIPLLQSTDTNTATSLTGILSTIGCYILTVIGKDSCTTFMIQTEGTLHAILADIQTWEDDGIQLAESLITHQTVVPAPRPSYRVPSTDDRDVCFSALIATLADMCDSLGGTAAAIQDALSGVQESLQQAAITTGFVGNAYANAPECIRSCIWVPFDYALAPSSGGSGHIYLGTYDTGIQALAITGKPVTGSNTITIPWHYSDWRRGVCEDVYLYLPLVGMVQLSGDSLTHVSSLTIEWSVTYTDGVICYKVLAGSDVIGSYGGQCAANYPLGLAQQASAGEVVQSIMAGTEKMVSSVINSSISPLSIGGAVASIGLSAVTSAYNVENVKKSTHISCVGGVGGGAGIGLGRDCVCYTVSHPTIVNPSDMQVTMGLPTMKPMALSTLTGYCECANAHLEADLPSPILNAVDSMLNSGFFIE